MWALLIIKVFRKKQSLFKFSQSYFNSCSKDHKPYLSLLQRKQTHTMTGFRPVLKKLAHIWLNFVEGYREQGVITIIVYCLKLILYVHFSAIKR